MATASFSLYHNAADTTNFTLVSQSGNVSQWKVAERSLSTPYTITLTKKIGNSAASGNDHIVVKIERVERNTVSGKLATASITTDISIPRDTSLLSAGEISKIVKQIGSLFSDAEPVSATYGIVNALLDGRDM